MSVDMVKAMIFLKRREGMSLDAFRSWWIDRHRPMAEKLPGLRRHAFNLLAEGPYDAVVEQWFELLAAMRASYETEIGRDVVGTRESTSVPGNASSRKSSCSRFPRGAERRCTDGSANGSQGSDDFHEGSPRPRTFRDQGTA